MVVLARSGSYDLSYFQRVRSTLPLAKQRRKRVLTAEAPDDPLGGVRFLFHVSYPNGYFVIMRVRARKGQITKVQP